MRRSRRKSSLSRRVAILAAAVVATAALCVPAASASRFLQVGLFDDAQFNYGNPDKVFPGAEAAADADHPGQPRLGRRQRRRQAPAAQSCEPERPRLRLVGLRPHGAASRSRTGSRSSSRSSGRRRGRTAPPASTSRPAARSTSSVSRRRRLAATAAPSPARDGRILPAVRSWLAWSEPNNPAFLRPQYRKVGGKFVIQSAIDYAKICNAVAKGVRKTTVGASKVACGVTGPAGQQQSELDPAGGLAAGVPAGDEEGRRHRLRRLRAPPLLRGAARDSDHASAARNPRECQHRGHAREHQRSDQGSDAAVRQQANLDHGVRLSDESARPDRRRLPGQPGSSI